MQLNKIEEFVGSAPMEDFVRIRAIEIIYGALMARGFSVEYLDSLFKEHPNRIPLFNLAHDVLVEGVDHDIR